MKILYMAILVFVIVPVFNGCSPGFDVPVSPSDNVLFVLTTDYSGSGSCSTIELDTLVPYRDLGAGLVHTDSYCRYFDGLIYVVNAKGRNNVQVIDPDDNFSTQMEISVKENSDNDCNPHDIVPCGSGLALVTRYDDSEIWILDLAAGNKYGEIDLSSYGYSGNNPHMHTMYHDEAEGRVYVALQRLDSSYKPSDYSSVVVINTGTMSVEEEIVLTWNDGNGDVYATNPISCFRHVTSSQWDPGDGHDHLLVSCVGSFGAYYAEDGGLVAIDMTDLDTEPGYLVSEEDLEGEINDFIITATSRGYAVISDVDYRTRLVEFDLSTGSVLKTIRSNDDSYGALGNLAFRESSGTLFYGDRMAKNPGVRVYDTANDEPLNGDAPVYVGLPPAGMCIIE